MEVNEISKGAMGGTELMMHRIYSSIDPNLLEQFQIIPSRVRELKEDKVRILYLHDLPGDPESDKALNNNGWTKFHRIVCVSNWQMQAYINRYNIPWSRCTVIQNSIEPIERELPWKIEADEPIRFIYHTTPHRGLDILVAVFNKLATEHEKIHLDVYSSFEIYGWEDRDKEYQALFDEIKKNSSMTYHGAVTNEEVRQALTKAHIYAYPSTWLETSCLSLIEAMSAGLICVHPNLGALYETSANWTAQYQWNENKNKHAGIMYNILNDHIKAIRETPEYIQTQLMNQKAYCDVFYNWSIRKTQWNNLLLSLVNEPREFEKEMYVYRA